MICPYFEGEYSVLNIMAHLAGNPFFSPLQQTLLLDVYLAEVFMC